MGSYQLGNRKYVTYLSFPLPVHRTIELETVL